MHYKQWNELPVQFQNEKIKPYYQMLSKHKTSIRIKRILDFVLAFCLTAVLSPVMLILAVCIKIDSRGPVFYRQERVTQYGKMYRIFKFRTMVADADKRGPAITQSGDRRITRMGNVLRKCRLDELPQLFNVLTGDMSFVGTRPEVKKYVDAYTDEMTATLLLPAGITSRTSIVYKDEDEVMEKYLKETGESVDEVYIRYVLPEKMKYNLQYLKKFSVLGDLKIMIDTVLAVIH
ncbi:sugar transferase [Mediterraneibacter agrestimuris]|uniref:sugar transferase n=1 Tax=Mediterraneibacter agrestimuris TaxID=2941333 RepID=UPI00203D5A1C|nr:sugar transferase [Mediterraneibacter agrestimuris]